MEKQRLIWNNKLKLSGPRWNEEFKLSGGSYSLSDIQVYSSLSMPSKKMKHLLTCHQSKFILAIFKKEFHSKLNKDTTRNYETTWKATQKKIIDTNCVSILQWEITEAVSVHFNFVITPINMIQELFIHSHQINNPDSFNNSFYSSEDI